jgi:hypothetical protein
MRYSTHSRSYRFLWLLLVPIIVVALAYGWKVLSPKLGIIGKVADQKEPVITSIEPVSLSMRSLLVGNVYWNGTIDDAAQKSIDKEKYLFSQSDSLGRTNYDIWIGALGCGISGVGSDKNSCKSSYLKEVKKWFSAFALSSSKVEPESGDVTTKKDLAGASIGYFGNSSAASTENICSVFSMPARFKLKDDTYKTASLPLALCGVNYIDSTSTVNIKDTIKKYSDLMPVFAYNYSGPKQGGGVVESDIQRAVARDLINSGVDVVVGTNPSSVQSVETYNGKLIAYSLGDFLANKLADTTTELARFGLGLEVTVDAPIDNTTAGWVELSKTCQPFVDACLDQARAKGLKKPAYNYSYNMKAIDTNGGQPKKAEPVYFDKIARAIGWNTVELPGMIKN